MKIIKKKVDRYFVGEKEFKKEEEATKYIDKDLRMEEFKKKVSPYIKDNYIDRNDFFEDLYMAFADNFNNLVDIVNGSL